MSDIKQVRWNSPFWPKLTEAPSKLAQIKLGKLYLFGFNLSKFRLNLSRAC
jgi:hypothetical protein